ncbi:MAG: Gfo/Idh/MocA family oxidoreductase, partial [Actinomycetota bacterium]|nr:Gfo/Idh/MocA family oxidoreductase [Actinomycetota bacterium]
MNEVSVGVVGLGYWGPNLLRNFRSVESCRVVAMADADRRRLDAQQRLYPDVRAYLSAEELLDDDSIEAVAFALPAGLIPDLATRALDRGKHVMVEKPMAHSLDEGLRMLKAADAADRVGMVDFTFVYSPPVRYLHSLLESGSLGNAHYYQSTRINLGRFQPDVDVIWDLVVHDIAILLYLFEV